MGDFAGTTDFIPGITICLPLFYEDSVSVMIKHAMELIKQVTLFLNGNQILVMAVNQLLFAIVKLKQWNYLEIYGETKFLVLVGAFHIKQSLRRVLGACMSGSEWDGAISHADVAFFSAAESFLKVIHVEKARYMHQVTATALYHLLLDAHHGSNTLLEFKLWCGKRAKESVCYVQILAILFKSGSPIVSIYSFIRGGNYSVFNVP